MPIDDECAQTDDGGRDGTVRTRVRVLVADDDPAVRDALVDLVTADEGLEVVAVASDAAQAVALAAQRQPDVALLDVRMPRGGGHWAAQELRSRAPGCRTVALSAHGDRAAVVGMVGSGAVGYLIKGAAGTDIISTIHRAVNGYASLDDEVATEVVHELSGQLQAREREVRAWQEKVARVQAALSPTALKIVGQPIYDLGRDVAVGVEALARFSIEPLQPPNLWFADAAEVGLGIELEVAAARAALEHLPELDESLFLALNVSPEALLSPRFAEACLSDSEILPRLVVEVTEHAPIDSYHALERALHDARSAGLRLAVDDVGAGYASLQHILRLAPDIIKLDISLTRNLDVDSRRRALATALMPFAREIGATVIAEGIETRQELDALRSLGAACGQGYFLARPEALPLPASLHRAVVANPR